MKIPYHNDTEQFVTIGAVTIAPGHTRDVEESHLAKPNTATAAATTEPEADDLAALLNGNAESVIAGLADLAAADLDRLGELEQTGKARKTVLAAIAERLLTLADEAQGQ